MKENLSQNKKVSVQNLGEKGILVTRLITEEDVASWMDKIDDPFTFVEGFWKWKRLYKDGHLVAEAPSEWRPISTLATPNTTGLIQNTRYEKIVDINSAGQLEKIYGSRLRGYDASRHTFYYPFGKKIRYDNIFDLEHIIYSGYFRVQPYTKELRQYAAKTRGRSTFAFSDGASVCILPSESFYKRPGMLNYLDKVHKK